MFRLSLVTPTIQIMSNLVLMIKSEDFFELHSADSTKNGSCTYINTQHLGDFCLQSYGLVNKSFSNYAVMAHFLIDSQVPLF